MTRQAIRGIALACSLGTGLTGCGTAPADVGPLADVIFFGSNIVTMDPNQPTVDAVAVRGETITAAGTSREMALGVVELAMQAGAERLVTFAAECLPGIRAAAGDDLEVIHGLEIVSEAMRGG